MPPPAHGYEVAASALLDNDVDKIFGLLGDANLATAAHMVERGARLYASRHESGAVMMAAGFSVSSGKVGLATVTRGPGLTNAVTALTTAVRDQVPLVLFAGDTPPGDDFGPQNIDHEAVARLTGARFLPCEDASAIRATVDASFVVASTEKRPVVLDIPTNLLHGAAVPQTGGARTTADPLLDPDFWSPPQAPDPEAVARALEVLMSARRPVILAGRGAGDAGAADDLAALAAETGALLTTSLPMNGLFFGDPFSVGFSGGFATATVRELLGAADAVLAVGASLNSYTTMEGRLYDQATIVHCDSNPDAIGRQHHADVRIVADAGLTAQALLEAARTGGRDDAGYRSDEVRARIRSSLGGRDLPDESRPGALDPRTVLAAVDDALPEQRRMVTDVGHFTTFPCQMLVPRYPSQLMAPFGFGSIGLALSTGLGVAAAHPDEPTLVVLGDGGLLMSLSELETCARLGLPLVLVVLNDHSYAAEVHHLRRHGLPTTVAHFPSTDFAGMAEALGVRAHRVSEPSQLEELEDLLAEPGPVLLDVEVNPDVVADKWQLKVREAQASGA